jgi:hypothetical protein
MSDSNYSAFYAELQPTGLYKIGLELYNGKRAPFNIEISFEKVLQIQNTLLEAREAIEQQLKEDSNG